MITTTTNSSGTSGTPETPESIWDIWVSLSQLGPTVCESGSTWDTWAHLGPSGRLGTPGPNDLFRDGSYFVDEIRGFQN